MSGILHNGPPPNDYYDTVNTQIADADAAGGKQGVLDALSDMKNSLSSANRGANWRTVLGPAQ
jgi:hypothetical protein